MKTTLVDSNIILDVATSDPTWAEWSAMALETAANESVLAMNALIYGKCQLATGESRNLSRRFQVQFFGGSRYRTKRHS